MKKGKSDRHQKKITETKLKEIENLSPELIKELINYSLKAGAILDGNYNTSNLKTPNIKITNDSLVVKKLIKV
ncbi:hypothetical protein ACFFJY_00360 [Fictibacillus aquaticus]|uniref:Uncharacterized protein n=1 Tax=Fictibacillus aquaticus TaxID=2021314 RepID=A0A235F7H2_9BACL|nr:hypothetical protein [Fictibacillus aquaticus]OYD57182.1 hypothetical protein CGZ90_10840 [Fictibacillus aquaticus]